MNRMALALAGFLVVFVLLVFFMPNTGRQYEDERLTIGSRENCATMPRTQYCDFLAHLEPGVTYILGDSYYEASERQSSVPLEEWITEVEQWRAEVEQRAGRRRPNEPKPSVIWLRMVDTVRDLGDVY